MKKKTSIPQRPPLIHWINTLFIMIGLGWFSISMATAANETFPAGAFIVNMGVVPQTEGNGLKPYGMVYDLLKNYGVNVRWVINESKDKDGTDFIHEGVTYRGGTFIIPANLRTTAVNSAINSWKSQGVVGNTTSTPLTVDVDYVLKVAPKWVLDHKNGSIAAGFFESAGIPATAHGGSSDKNWKEPSELNSCDDIFVMPHADPTWTTHSNLYDWNKDHKGAIWAGCHAVSVLENLKNPANTIQMNFLTSGSPNGATSGLIPYGDHDDPELPFTHVLPGDPASQYMGITDEAHTNGSERVFLPKVGGSWLPSTKMITYASIVKKTTYAPGTAAINVYGRAFGDNTRGQVMYQAGHDIGGNKAENVGAQRIFFNWSFLAIIDKAPQLALSLPPGSSEFVGASAQIQLGAVSVTPGVTYKWTNSCGGTFSNANIANPIFTAPNAITNTPCLITCTVTDACGRETVESKSITVVGPITLSGSVFNDANGLSDLTVNGTKIGQLSSSPSIPLYVNISDAAGTTVASVAVDPAGNYQWTTANYNNEEYTFSLNTIQATVGQPKLPTPSSLTGKDGAVWANTGENMGTGTGSDGTPNGEVKATIANAGIANINFGIEMAPIAGKGNFTATNAKGSAFIDVPLATFTNMAHSSDDTPGNVAKIIITSIPANATAIKINGVTYDSGNPMPINGVEISTDANGLPVSGTTISINPDSDGATTVVIPFVAVDNAGVKSVNKATEGQATVALSAPLQTISGSVFNDTNGLSDLTVNGTKIGNLGTTGTPIALFVNITDATDIIVATIPVDLNTGVYAWTEAPDGNHDYILSLSIVSATIGQPRPANPTLIVGKSGDTWKNTGETTGSGAGNDGNPNGELAISTTGSGITNANFGIELAPTAGQGTANAANVAGNAFIDVPLTAFHNTASSTDPSPGTVTKIVITAIPTHASAIKINGVTYDSGNPIPAEGIEIVTDANGVPVAGTTVAVDPAVNGAIAVIIPFVAKDNADIKSVNKGTEGQAILNLTAAPVTVNGLVWSDNNGNGVQDEGETGTNAGGLFVNLLDGTDKIVTSCPVETDGLYSLPDVPAHATGYMLVLAATNSAKAPSLPNRDWVNTGDHIGVGNKASQGSTLGMIELATSAENVDNQNFGIQNINPLPVKLISFKAHASENKVELDWTTAEEENFSHFEVQRSANGQSFTTFHQESNTGLYRYHTTDSQPLGGDNYYRLKMVDYDGSYAFSRTEVVKRMTATTWAIYPNPAFDEITLTHTDKTIESTKVLDVSGRILKYSLGQAPIQVTDLPAGTYILQALFSDRTVQTKKFVVTR